MEKRVSEAVIRRMPRYYRHLCELHDSGVTRISSGQLAQRLGLTASQVRQDFNCFGGFGQQGYGYHVAELRDSIAGILSLDCPRTAVLVGVGKIGRALMSNFRFDRVGIKLIGAFDSNPELSGTDVSGVPVMAVEQMESFLRENAPDIAILTLPQDYARAAARDLVRFGIKALWNFTNTDLQLPEDGPQIPVENVHFSDSLMVLAYRLKEE